MPDQQCEPRFRVFENLRIRVAFQPEDHRLPEQIMAGEVLDLSKHGARLSVPGKIPTGSRFRIEFLFAEMQLQLFVSAKSCWTQEDGEKSVIGCRLQPGIPDRFLVCAGADSRADPQMETLAEEIVLLACSKMGDKLFPVRIYSYTEGDLSLRVDRHQICGAKLHICVDEFKPVIIVANVQWTLKENNTTFIGCRIPKVRDCEFFKRRILLEQNSKPPA